VQSSGREEVTGADVLVAIFAKREAHAVYFLQEQEMTRYDAVNYITHGIAKRPGLTESGRSTVLFSAALEGTMRRALADANAREHEYATLVHLLRALIDDVDASAVMKARQSILTH
jgi:ATP-dependent Clp protease ATP-binding subunit ClpA